MARVPMLPKEYPAQRISALWTIVGALTIAAFLYFLFAPAVMTVNPPAPAALPPPPTNAQPPAAVRPAPQAQPGTIYGTNSLPPCASVTDTRTACQGAPQEEQAPAAVQELPTEAPAPTATPPYLSNCETVPGERPCWLPADQPWQPPAEVPSTPIVVVDEGWHAPMALPADVCADWHPPQTMPEGCGDDN